MKILFTGFQGRHCRESSYKMDYAPTARYTIATLRALGHEVDVRKIELGDESIKMEYDIAFVGLMGYNMISALGNRFPALWAQWCLPHVPFIDDWQLSAICGPLAKPSDSPWRQDDAHLLKAINMDEIHAVIEHNRKLSDVLLPVHPWGDPEGIREHWPGVGTVWSFDPTPWVFEELKNCYPNLAAQRLRDEKWFCTSLSNVDAIIKRVQPTWPVEGYWDKKRHAYISEPTVISQKLLTYGGVFLPTHWKGCKVPGWFRCRWAHYAWTEIPIFCEGAELGKLADVPGLFPSVTDIEAMPHAARRELAHEQSSTIKAYTAMPDQEVAKLEAIIPEILVPPVCSK